MINNIINVGRLNDRSLIFGIVTVECHENECSVLVCIISLEFASALLTGFVRYRSRDAASLRFKLHFDAMSREWQWRQSR